MSTQLDSPAWAARIGWNVTRMDRGGDALKKRAVMNPIQQFGEIARIVGYVILAAAGLNGLGEASQ